MLLELGIEISSRKTWLRKWTMRVVAVGKISAYLLQAGKS